MSTYFMRHGETFSETTSKDMTVKEATEKLSLSEKGKRQMQEVRIPKNIDVIVISDSLRTRQSADIIIKANKLKIPVKVEKQLSPWDSGADNWDDYWERYIEFSTNYSPRAKYENKDSLRKRVQSVLDKYQGKNILIIAHSVLLANYIGKDFLPYAEVFRVKKREDTR